MGNNTPTKLGSNWHARLNYPMLYQRHELKKRLSGSDRFYVYVIWRQDVGPLTPFYVGKGRYDRIFHHQMGSELAAGRHKDNIIRKLLREDEVILYSYHFLNTEQQAFEAEKDLIKSIGRNDLGRGPLANLTDGGEGSSGHLGLRGGASPTARPVYAEGIRYEAISDAARVLQIDEGIIRSRCKNGWPGFYFEDTGQLELKDGAVLRYKKKTTTPVGEFPSLAAAAKACGTTSKQLFKWIRWGHEGYFYSEEGQLPRRKHEKPVEIEGVAFGSRKAANEFFDFDIRKRLASGNYPNWIDLSGTIVKAERRQPRQPIIVNGRYFESLSSATRAMNEKKGVLAYRAASSNYPEVICEGISKQSRDPKLAKDSISVSIKGVNFPSLSAAARAKGIDVSTLKTGLQSTAYKYRDWLCEDPDLQKTPPKDDRPGLCHVVIFGEEYRSISAAAQALNMRRDKVKKRCESDDPEDKEWVMLG